LCTIETPEGPNIGLISTLCVHASINDMGFIETPYRKVQNGKVNMKELTFLSAEEEDTAKIAQSNSPLNEKGEFVEDKVVSRQTGDFPILEKGEVEFMDVAPNQIVGLSASLIPFLEHDDANRALMGSNMQRQAVPLLRPESPIVGTGLEGKAARDARIQMHAEGNGVVEFVDANEIHVRYDRNDIDRLVSFNEDLQVYKLTKFVKTNQATCINLRPAVRKGQKVKKGDFLTEGYATKDGELALGRNLQVAFMPWKGYNFEDAIVISEKVVREDLFTSVHIEEYELEVRDTKLGEEELTPDIPNVSEEATKDLDEHGIIRIGATVKEGDILIGKITPKGESDPTPEEKLLRAIFGDKAGDAKDASLKAPNGTEGVVIDKKLFQRAKKDKNGKIREKALLEKVEKVHTQHVGNLQELLLDKLQTLLKDKASAGVSNNFGEMLISKGSKFNQKSLSGIDYQNVNPLGWTGDAKTDDLINTLLHNYNIKFNEELGRYKREKFNISIGDELPAGVLKLAKVYLAVKRKLKVGDKMAGRHGNKGIVAKIVRAEDMPFMEDGTPVDIVLNPLGVPSRMNLGQIYETILGWTGKKLGLKFSTPIFDGASTDQIESYCKDAGIPRNGHTYLYDGETGERFHQKATVGVIYMIKLHHMVDDKMHARSIGPYSLITQQPLGGKAQFGGQRFGEMEVWALEAYGASNILQELLTLKSDDIIGRAKTYEAIVKGDNIPRAGVPESFNVLVHELRGLGLDLKFE
jgi:DNA-directed RNA polymerase subunit beta